MGGGDGLSRYREHSRHRWAEAARVAGRLQKRTPMTQGNDATLVAQSMSMPLVGEEGQALSTSRLRVGDGSSVRLNIG